MTVRPTLLGEARAVGDKAGKPAVGAPFCPTGSYRHVSAMQIRLAIDLLCPRRV